MSWLPAEVTSAPASEPLSVADATEQVKADASDATDQAYILALTKAARAHVESWTGLKLVTQTVRLRRRDFEADMLLPIAPVQSISSVKYLDTAGAEQTLATTVWDAVLYGKEPRVYLAHQQTWPSLYTSPEAVTITAVVGFTTLPEEIGHALKLLVSSWYDQRAGTSEKMIAETPHAVAALLSNWRLFAF